MSTYVWCEDTGSGYEFWKQVFGTLYEDYTVESKNNNTELCKAVSKITEKENKYYILLDNAIDNPEVLRETQRLYSAMKDRDNVSAIKIHSFEFVLLSFRMLTDWVFSEQDELREKRKTLLALKDILVDVINNGGDISKLQAMKNALKISENMNTEQLSAKLLFEITRNTGFETTKGKLGECFVVDCCEWAERMSNDICGLDESRMTSNTKILEIYENSVLKDSFAKAGL